MTGPAAVGTAWMVDALCARRLELPWTLDADQVDTWERVTMTVLCDRCPVRAACASSAHQVSAEAGFWAGSHWDTAPAVVTADGPSWVASPLPGLDGAA